MPNCPIQFNQQTLLSETLNTNDVLKFVSTISEDSCDYPGTVYGYNDKLMLKGFLSWSEGENYFQNIDLNFSNVNPYENATLNLSTGDKPLALNVPLNGIDMGNGGKKKFWFCAVNTDKRFYCSDTPILYFKYYNGPCEANFEVVKDSTVPGVFYCNNNSFGSNLQYVWYFRGDTSTSQFPVFTTNSQGYLRLGLTVYNSAGCSFYLEKNIYVDYKKEEGPIQIIVRQGTPTFTGLQNIEEALAPVIFPNPATNTLNIGLDNKLADEIAIYDLSGKQLMRAIQPSSNQIDISSLANGMYMVQVKAVGKQSLNKWIKQ